MKSHSRTAGLGALLLLMAIAATAGAGVVLPLGSSSQIPAASGEVQLNGTRNGNVQIKWKVKHLAPPGRVVAGANVYVVWARGLAPDSAPQNLGALIVDKNLNGKLTAVTAMPAFDLFITCEQSQTVLAPTPPELLPVNYTRK